MTLITPTASILQQIDRTQGPVFLTGVILASARCLARGGLIERADSKTAEEVCSN